MRRFVAIAILVAALASPAKAADRHSLVVRGTVVDAAGAPMASARVFLEGPVPAATNVDANGRYTLKVPVADWSALERAPLTVWVDAGRNDWTFNLVNGTPALRLEVRASRDSTGARHCVIQSNDNAVTAKLAGSVARRGALRDTIELRFIGTAGPDPGFRDLEMFSKEEVAVPSEPANETGAPLVSKGAAVATTTSTPSPAKTTPAEPIAPAPTPAAAKTTAKKPGASAQTSKGAAPGPSSARADSIEAFVVVRPGDTVAVHSPSAGTGCACRIEGTVEVMSREPLSGRTLVVFWLEADPATRDSVELFMGSPRPFTLMAKRCGSHRVRYDARSRQRLNLASPDPVIECAGQRTRQVRIVLAPPGR